MASRDVLKVSALHYKDPSKTDEEFERHVCENINPAWVELVKRHEVMRYSIVSGPRLPTCLGHTTGAKLACISARLTAM
jgi:hypothetical protein